MEIHSVSPFSKEHFEAIKLREQVLDSKVNMKKEAKLTVFVSVENGQVVGTAAVQLYPFRIVRIRQVAVSPEFQGLKIGNQLMDYCEAFAKEQHHTRVILTGRKTATLFYLKRNYHILLHPFKKDAIDFFWMMKKVGESNTKKVEYSA